MNRSQQRTSARCRIAIVVLSLAVAVGTASAQHGAPDPHTTQARPSNPHVSRSIDRSAAPRTVAKPQRGFGNQKVHVDQQARDEYRNQRGPVVVARPVPYARVPYYYGTHPHYSYYPYYYHPYHSYAWGPEPPGSFFAPSLGSTVSTNSEQYYYDRGAYYVPANGGYTLVEAPAGATVSSLPPSAEAVVVNGKRGYYYFGGTYYQQTPTGFVVVAPIPGMVVESFPQGGSEVRIGARAYVQVGNTYYEPIQRNGKDMWQVVETPQSE